MSPTLNQQGDIVNQMPSTPTADILELVHTVMHRYRSLQYQFLRDGPLDITHMDGKVLGYLFRHPGTTQSGLAQHMDRDKAQLARLIKGLRDRELLVGESDPRDGRILRLTLTPAGHAIVLALREQARRLNETAVEGFSEAERQQLLALMLRVNDNLAGETVAAPE